MKFFTNTQIFNLIKHAAVMPPQNLLTHFLNQLLETSAIPAIQRRILKNHIQDYIDNINTYADEANSTDGINENFQERMYEALSKDEAYIYSSLKKILTPEISAKLRQENPEFLKALKQLPIAFEDYAAYRGGDKFKDIFMNLPRFGGTTERDDMRMLIYDAASEQNNKNLKEQNQKDKDYNNYKKRQSLTDPQASPEQIVENAKDLYYAGKISVDEYANVMKNYQKAKFTKNFEDTIFRINDMPQADQQAAITNLYNELMSKSNPLPVQTKSKYLSDLVRTSRELGILDNPKNATGQKLFNQQYGRFNTNKAYRNNAKLRNLGMQQFIADGGTEKEYYDLLYKEDPNNKQKHKAFYKYFNGSPLYYGYDDASGELIYGYNNAGLQRKRFDRTILDNLRAQDQSATLGDRMRVLDKLENDYKLPRDIAAQLVLGRGRRVQTINPYTGKPLSKAQALYNNTFESAYAKQVRKEMEEMKANKSPAAANPTNPSIQSKKTPHTTNTTTNLSLANPSIDPDSDGIVPSKYMGY